MQFTLLIACVLFAGNLLAQSQFYSPRPSAASEITQKIGITDITINYSRPQVNSNGTDRTGKIYGTQVVHYGYRPAFPTFGSGNEFPWRAGANENTTIEFSTDVQIEGKPLAAGKYGLHMVLSEDGNETLIFNKKSDAWGSFFYDEKDDALRVTIQSEATAFTNILTYDFEEIGINYGVITLKWENKKFPFRVDVDTDKLVMDNYKAKLDELNDPTEYMAAAQYCWQNRAHYEEGLAWIDKSIALDKNFNSLSVKAGLLYRQSGIEAALSTTDEAVEFANKAQLNQMGHQLIQVGAAEKAVEYFAINVKRHPEDANAHDSLGEGYKAIGEKKKAIKSFKKSLSLNPPDNVRDHSIAQLKELGVNIDQ